MNYPEQLQFRAPAGTSSELQRVAESEGKTTAQLIREALNRHLAASAEKAA